MNSKLKDKVIGNSIYNNEFHILLGTNPKIYVDAFNDVMISYSGREKRTISFEAEDLDFYKELLK